MRLGNCIGVIAWKRSHATHHLKEQHADGIDDTRFGFGMPFFAFGRPIARNVNQCFARTKLPILDPFDVPLADHDKIVAANGWVWNLGLLTRLHHTNDLFEVLQRHQPT